MFSEVGSNCLWPHIVRGVNWSVCGRMTLTRCAKVNLLSLSYEKLKIKDTSASHILLFFFLNFLTTLLNFIYLFIFAVLGLRFCARAFSSCGKRGPLFIAVRGPLTIAASLAAEHRLQTRRLSNCGPRAQLLRGMWDLPRPGLEPVSPALAGRFSTTVPPGKPPSHILLILID